MKPHLLLTVYVDETDMEGEIPLYEAIVRRLLARNIAGATVQIGLMGYGAGGKVHRKRLFGVSDDRPVTIMAVDQEDKIQGVIAEVRAMVRQGLLTVAPVDVL